MADRTSALYCSPLLAHLHCKVAMIMDVHSLACLFNSHCVLTFRLSARPTAAFGMALMMRVHTQDSSQYQLIPKFVTSSHPCIVSQDVIENQIYPPLSNGFSDENAYIRELTLKSILTLAPKMKQATLTSNLLKHLSRLQVCISVKVLGQKALFISLRCLNRALAASTCSAYSPVYLAVCCCTCRIRIPPAGMSASHDPCLTACTSRAQSTCALVCVFPC